MKRFLIFVALVVLMVFLIYRWNEQRSPVAPFTPAAAPLIDLKDVQVLAALDSEYTRLAEAVLPSVVSLTTSRKVKNAPIVDPFEFLFGRRRGGQEFVQNSLGSGVIVSSEGHIITNHHVVADMDEVKVHLRDGRIFPARIIGGDEVSDIAVLKIEASDIRPLPLGDSDLVKVGSLVLAVGNPFGLQESVTHGMISATGRQVSSESDAEFFQTDTAINPGNSGGPLINLRGEIIGINNAIGNYSGSGTWQGVGFAIPSNVAKRSMEHILKNGRVIRNGYLGVVIQQLSPERASQLGIPGREGAIVMGVAPGSPAEKGGVKVGDIIIGLNGKPVTSLRELLRRVAAVEVGATVEIQLLRDGQEETVKAVIEEQPQGGSKVLPLPIPRGSGPAPGTQPYAPQRPQSPFTQPLPPIPAPGAPGAQGGNGAVIDNGLAGVEVGPIPGNRRGLYPENVNGVMVTEVDPDAPAAGGLRRGDVIEEINRQPVDNVETYQALSQEIPPGRRVMLSIARGKIRSYLVIMPH